MIVLSVLLRSSVPQSRGIIVIIAVITPDTGINRVSLGCFSGRYHYRPVGMVVQIQIYILRITASAAAYIRNNSLLLTVCLFQHVGPVAMSMRRLCR